jgi:transposase-like protein
MKLWSRIVREQRQSGMSVAAFAAEHELNRHTLQWWRCHVGGQARRAAGAPPFIEIAAPPPCSPTAPFEAVLPSGVIVRGHDGDQLARLVTALLRSC